MNIGTIVTPNVKGQIVIPLGIRRSLGITEDTPLQVLLAGQSVVLYPIAGITRRMDADSTYVDVLKRTQGSWAGDDWPKTERRRHRIEQKAARQRRKNSW